MKIDCTKYYETLNKSKHYLEKDNANNIEQTISELGCYSGVPLLAIIVFYMNTYGETPSLNKFKDRMIKFYGYTEVIE